MDKIGIICEYNPFHNGHAYHLKKVKEMYPDSIIILVMSGYFTERGEISLISKYNKTRIALKYGVDIVLELPTLYGVNSGDYFGDAALKILNYAGVDKVVFGSETDDMEVLKKAAFIQLNNNEFDEMVKKYLDDGLNYPTALSKACGNNFKSNDLLGISYIKSILKNNYNIIPVTIRRTNDFNDTQSNDEIISATNIREKYKNGISIKKFIPEYNYDYINKINEDKIFELLKYKIITSNNLNEYLGVDEGLDNKLKVEIDNVVSLGGLIEKLKSKRYTYVRLQRMLVHILLGIKKDDMDIELDCARILGFSIKGQKYLKELQSDKLVYKVDNRSREIEMRATKVYKMVTDDKSCMEEYLNAPIRD